MQEINSELQEEIDKVLTTVRSDKKERALSDEEEKSVTLSQSELEKILESVPLKVENLKAPEESKEEVEQKAKIAERQAQPAAMFAEANAHSPKRISVIYGSLLCDEEKFSSIKEGTVLDLDRAAGEVADILVDGKLYAKGMIGAKNGKTAVKITLIV